MPIDGTKALTAIFDEIKDLALKMFVGVIIFVPIDGVLGLIFHHLLNQTNIFPFLILTKSFEWISFIYHNTNLYFTILTLSLFLYALGKAIYILRQPIILDKIKNDYTLFASNEKEVKLFKELRNSVIRRLKTDKKFNVLHEIGWEIIENNDYLLYLILGKYYPSPDIQKRNQEANEIAFIGTSIIVLTVLSILFYILKTKHVIPLLVFILFVYSTLYLFIDALVSLLKIRLFNNVLLLLLFIGLTLMVFLSFFPKYELELLNSFILITLGILVLVVRATIVGVAKRYISRNKRLYLNYLITDNTSN